MYASFNDLRSRHRVVCMGPTSSSTETPDCRVTLRESISPFSGFFQRVAALHTAFHDLRKTIMSAWPRTPSLQLGPRTQLVKACFRSPVKDSHHRALNPPKHPFFAVYTTLHAGRTAHPILHNTGPQRGQKSAPRRTPNLLTHSQGPHPTSPQHPQGRLNVTGPKQCAEAKWGVRPIKHNCAS